MPFPEIPEFKGNEHTGHYVTEDPVVATAIYKETNIIPMRLGTHHKTVWLFTRSPAVHKAANRFRDLYASAGVTDFHRFVIHLMLDCGQLEMGTEKEWGKYEQLPNSK